MDINTAISNAVSLLQSLEGYRATAYYDVNGYAIGYGNHYYENGAPVKRGDVITNNRALSLLNHYAATNAAAIVAQLSTPIPTGLLTSLISLRYNCGSLPGSLVNLINSGSDLAAIKQKFLSTCVTSAGNYNSGLAERRAREWEAGLRSAGVSLLTSGVVLFGLYWLLKRYLKST